MTPDVQPGTGWPAKFPGMPRQPTFTPPAFSVWNMTKKMGTDRKGEDALFVSSDGIWGNRES